MSSERDLIEEAAFADAEYLSLASGTEINPGMFARYQRPTDLWDWRQRAASLLGPVQGKRLLDYGCGQGEEAAYFASLGATVTAIDISPEGIRIANERAQANGLASRCTAMVMTAVPTAFDDASFDLIHGLGILHHLDLSPALQEIHRLLVPGGAAVFLEPIGNSNAIEGSKEWLHGRFARYLRLRPLTSGERNLRIKDVRLATAAFETVNIYPYHLLHRIRKLIAPRRFYHRLLRADHVLLKAMPPLAYFCGGAVIHLRKAQ